MDNVTLIYRDLQKGALGCVNPASWLPLAAGGEFKQPRAHLLANPCIICKRLAKISIGYLIGDGDMYKYKN